MRACLLALTLALAGCTATHQTAQTESASPSAEPAAASWWLAWPPDSAHVVTPRGLYARRLGADSLAAWPGFAFADSLRAPRYGDLTLADPRGLWREVPRPDGRCDLAIPIPNLAPSSGEHRPRMPEIDPPGLEPVPIPNYCEGFE